MDSRILNCGFLCSTLILGCGSAKVKPTGVIGTPLDDITLQYSSDVIQRSQLFFYDQHTRRILKLDVDDFALTEAFSVKTAGDDHRLLSNSTGDYVIDFSQQHLQIVRTESDREDRPFKFQGAPVSAAFHDGKGILVMLDSLQSIGLMMLSSRGAVVKSWLGGSLIGSTDSLVAGDLCDSGALILSSTTGAVLVIDVEKTIDTGAWSYESFATDLGSITWIAPEPKFPDYALVTADEKVAVIDIKQHKVVAVRELAKGVEITNKGKIESPHVLLSSASGTSVEMLTIGEGGVLNSKPLPSGSDDYLTTTIYRRSDQTLTALFIEYGIASIRQLRLSDNLVTADNSFPAEGKTQISGTRAIMNAQTPLGHIEQHELGSDDVKVLDGFNFDYLRSR